MKHSREFCYAEIQNSCPLVWAQAHQGEYCRCCHAAIEALLRGLPPPPPWSRFKNSLQRHSADATEIMSPGEVVLEGVVVEQPTEPEAVRATTAGEVFVGPLSGRPGSDLALYCSGPWSPKDFDAASSTWAGRASWVPWCPRTRPWTSSPWTAGSLTPPARPRRARTGCAASPGTSHWQAEVVIRWRFAASRRSMRLCPFLFVLACLLIPF